MRACVCVYVCVPVCVCVCVCGLSCTQTAHRLHADGVYVSVLIGLAAKVRPRSNRPCTEQVACWCDFGKFVVRHDSVTRVQHYAAQFCLCFAEVQRYAAYFCLCFAELRH